MIDAYAAIGAANTSGISGFSGSSMLDSVMQALDAARIGGGAFDVYKLNDQLTALSGSALSLSVSLQSQIMGRLSVVEQAQLQALQTTQPSSTFEPVPKAYTTPYVVKPGDTIDSITQKFGVTQFELITANWDAARTTSDGQVPLKPGTTINMPQGQAAIIVQPGQTLADISKKYGVSEADLLASNGLMKAGDVTPGERLLIVPKNEFGLDKDKAVQDFVKDMRVLAGPNPDSKDGKWSTDAKEKYLEKIVNEQLAKAGVPPIDIAVRDLKGGDANNPVRGIYDDGKHQIQISKKLINADLTKPENLLELSKTIYHEARHADQQFNMYRVFAANNAGAKASDISKALQDGGVPKAVANAASKSPIDLKSEAGIYYFAMYNSVQGTGKSATDAIRDGIADGKVTPEDYAAYRWLPQELDSFRVDGKVAVYF
jgi:LysM repeat protein